MWSKRIAKPAQLITCVCNQEIFIEQIANPFTVYFDPNSILPDVSDAEKVLITEVISKEAFRKMYPNADDTNFTQRGTGDSNAEWVMKEDIRIAEYFYTERKRTKLLMLMDGTKVYKEDFNGDESDIIGERETVRKIIKWCKLTSNEILEADSGFAVNVSKVFMKPDTYPRFWK